MPPATQSGDILNSGLREEGPDPLGLKEFTVGKGAGDASILIWLDAFESLKGF